MVKKLLLGAAALMALSGCVAVPVYDAHPGHGVYYVPPAASVSFGYYRDSYRPGHGHRHGHGPRSRSRHRH